MGTFGINNYNQCPVKKINSCGCNTMKKSPNEIFFATKISCSQNLMVAKIGYQLIETQSEQCLKSLS